MLLNYAEAFAIISADIEKLRAQIILIAGQSNATWLTTESPKFQDCLNQVRRLLATCQQVPELDRMFLPCGRLISQMEEGMNSVAFHHNIDHLQMQLFDELRRLKLFLVNEHLVGLYEAEMPFGEVVFDRFPSAVPDSRNAGRCLALEQPTATMFHLMRVLEHGLTAYAAKLGIPYAPSWEAYIRQLNKEIEVEWKKKSKAWKAIEPFHKEILGDIVAIKIAWRNPTIHIVNDYDQQEALSAYFAVQKFMQNLAKKVKEPTRARRSVET